MTFLTPSQFRKDTVSEMRLTVPVGITGENSGEHTVTSASVQGEDCQGEWHRRTALIINTASLF